MVKKLSSNYDISRIKKDWKNIESKLTPDHWWGSTQIMIQHNGKVDYTKGCGTSYNMDEYSFKFINPLFKGTVFEEIINEYGGKRARILKMNPKSVYSIHQDWGKRIHLVISTNESSYFIFPHDNQVYHIPMDGYLYEADTSKHHTFINAHQSLERIHMVFCI